MPAVNLTLPDACLVETKDWHDLSADLAKLDDEEKTVPDSFEDCENGKVLALEDRNTFAEEWPGRHVFVVKGTEYAYIFDEIRRCSQ